MLARDRFGIKPLFWTVWEGRLLVAAEAKAFLGMGWRPRWNGEAIVSGAWQVGERTLFEGVRKVVPGGWVEVEVGGGGKMVKGVYWDLGYPDKVSAGVRSFVRCVDVGKAAAVVVITDVWVM